MSSDTPAPVGTSGLRLTRSDDADLLSGALHGWNQHYDQMTPGRFRGHLRQARGHGIGLFREVTSTGLRQSGWLEEDILAFGLPVATSGRGDFCGGPSHRDALHIFSGREGFEFHSAPGLDILGYMIPRRALAPYLDSADLDRLCPGTQTGGPGRRLVTLTPDLAAGLRRQVAEGFALLGRATSRDQNPDAAAEAWLQRTAGLLAEAFERPEARALPAAARRQRIFGQAVEQALAQGCDDKLAIGQICATQGISRRTLQYVFHEHAASSPERYLRMLRLNRARRMIKAGSSVTEAATHWGFGHLGRFAETYQQLFHERPSATRPRP